VADSSRIFLGQAGFIMIFIAAGLAFISTANAGIMSASRYPVALSNDYLLPPAFSRIHKKFKTPIISLAVTGILIIGSLFLTLELLVKVASSMILFSYILTNVAVLILRESRIQNYRPTFKVPFYPFTQILSIILFIFLLFEVGIAAVETVIIIIVISLLIYLFYGRKKHKREYALLYLIERIVNKKLSSANLENELKEILLNRDAVNSDRFDHLIEETAFLDIDESKTKAGLFKEIARQFCGDFKMKPAELMRCLVERERESSTALTPFLAIPHVIIDGEGIFKMLVVRVKDGVFFSEKFNSIKAIFVLIGSKDERQFHLQALSAIAQITQSKDFEKQWINARSVQNLKDICMLSERRRDSS
jgi:mannitol/fructose-specific phosphotransferase system IIA component (Ntr-type)